MGVICSVCGEVTGVACSVCVVGCSADDSDPAFIESTPRRVGERNGGGSESEREGGRASSASPRLDGGLGGCDEEASIYSEIGLDTDCLIKPVSGTRGGGPRRNLYPGNLLVCHGLLASH